MNIFLILILSLVILLISSATCYFLDTFINGEFDNQKFKFFDSDNSALLTVVQVPIMLISLVLLYASAAIAVVSGIVFTGSFGLVVLIGLKNLFLWLVHLIGIL